MLPVGEAQRDGGYVGERAADVPGHPVDERAGAAAEITAGGVEITAGGVEEVGEGPGEPGGVVSGGVLSLLISHRR